MTHSRDDSTWQWQHLLDDTCPTASTALTAVTSVHFTMSLSMTLTGTNFDRQHIGNWLEDCFCWSQMKTDRISMTSYSVLVQGRISGRLLHNSELDFGSRLHKQLALWKSSAHVSFWNPLGMPSPLVHLLCCRLPLLSFWIPTLFCNLTSASNRMHVSKAP